MRLYHLVGRTEWQARDSGSYAPASIGSEGFIHLSEARQLMQSATRFFAGRDDVLVVSISADRLSAPLRWDDVDGESFPHLYGPLNLDAVDSVLPLPRGAEGRFELPEALRAQLLD
jgi:uncharacterized protein (DUF952 family)